MSNKRKKYSAQEKVGLLRLHLIEKEPVSDICDRHGLNPNVFYRWQKVFFENGAAAFNQTGNGHKDSHAKKLERQNAQLKARLADWEKQAIIDYYYDHPLEGYRRLTYMMMDDDVEIILQRGREKFAEGVCWDSGLYIGRERTSVMRGVVKTHVRKYITDYLAANPKPPKRQKKRKSGTDTIYFPVFVGVFWRNNAEFWLAVTIRCHPSANIFKKSQVYYQHFAISNA